MPPKIKNIPKRYCVNCHKILPRLVPSQIKQGRGKFCSNRCANINENSHQWKGNNASIIAIHVWLNRHYKKPNKCNYCKKDKKLHWASINHKYTRNIKHYIALCPLCHRKYDILKNNLIMKNLFIKNKRYFNRHKNKFIIQ